MTTTKPPTHTPAHGDDPYSGPGAGSLKRIRARIHELQYVAGRVLDTPVIGPRGQHFTVREAMERAVVVTSSIDMAEIRGSLRHRVVSAKLKLLSLVSLVVVDFPLMLWLTSSVFNVDWTAPLDAPIYLVISIVVSILGTGSAAAVLYHLGRNQRENKTDQRRLVLKDLSPGSKASLLAVAFLVTLIAVVMFERVYTEGLLSGLNNLAALLAILVSFVMLVTALLVFFTAFRDGSPEQDDSAFLSALVQQHLQLQRAYEDEAHRLRQQYALLLPTEPTRDDRSLPPA
ncbi:hypothetical protein [Actinokineospora sp.]|uniref:hypothetical protein n=1 Tax=Actinokineospora sp. TaxID=1872133 RepID=UPI0040383AF8